MSVPITRQDSGCLLFLLDQSGSMSDPFGGDEGGTKAQGVSDAINRILATTVIRCTREDGVRRYFQVGVQGYGTAVGSAFDGPFTGRDLVWIDELKEQPARVEDRTRKVDDGAGGLVDQLFKMPVWFDPIAKGNTPMCEALQRAYPMIEQWVREHPNSAPPILMNLTDGDATDGDPLVPAEALQRLSTNHGNVRVFNCHLSSQKGVKILFPDSEAGLPDEFARRLFRMSSVLPPDLQELARNEGFQVSDQSRGFVFNGDLTDVIRFLNIGTPQNLER